MSYGSGQIAQSKSMDKDFTYDFDHIPINRITHGLAFVAITPSLTLARVVHTSLACPLVDPVHVEAVPLYEEEGELFVTYRGTAGQVTPCTRCPDLDFSWVSDAACQGAVMPFDNAEDGADFIAQYCEECPVVLECLSAGEAQYPSSAGAVWGGVFFTTSEKKRKTAIEHRRLREEQGL